jgi:DNA-directed RNA polymerase subunit H (RpoH/RPB5)
MARVRSPNYPQISLEDAVNRVAAIFSKEHQHTAPREVIIKDMGYNGIHGNSLGALSALSKYGLLERDGQDYKVSDRAIAIIHPESDNARLAALREAAQAPVLFAEIFEHFKGQLPSDENLKAYLIRKGFAESALTSVIVTLRDTMKFVGDTPLHVTGKGAMQAQPAQLSFTGHAPVVKISPPPLEQTDAVFTAKMRVSLTDHGVTIDANVVDKKGMDRLIAVLRANRELLPEVISNDPKADAGDSKSSSEEEVDPLLR